MPPDDILLEHAGEIASLKTNMENVKKSLDEMKPKLNELHDIMTQAKGARWAILSVAGLAGGIVSLLANKLGAIASFLFK